MSVWIEANLENLKNNIRAIRQKVGYDVQIMAVVKANGYGHGAAKIAEYSLEYGVDQLAVALIQEGIELRQQGIKAPILILGAILPEQVELIRRYSLTATVCNLSLASSMAKVGEQNQERIKCHVRVDIGAVGIGVSPGDAILLVEDILAMEWLELEGMYTHLPSAYGQNIELIERDLALFNGVLTRLKEKEIHIPIIHACSSPGIMKIPTAYYNMVRPGTCLYGLPSFENQEDWGIKPVMQLKAKIVDIKELGNGELSGYGYKYKTTKPTRVAAIPMGYADGFFMFMLKRGEVLICNKPAPVFGKSFMSHFLVDITHIPEAEIGDEVVILGEQGESNVTAEQLAYQSEIGTTNCESICLLSNSVPRIYL